MKGSADVEAINSAALHQYSVVKGFEKWDAWETERNALQHIKYIWHAHVKFGRPSTRE